MNPVADTSGKIEYVLHGVSETTPSGDIPSQFPLPVQFMERVTWNFHEKAIHPITKKETTHQGMDIAAPQGTPVYAAASGRVLKAELLGGWGKLLVIEHSEGYTTFYAHLEGFRIHSGDMVKKGQHVASVGNTGMSTAPHLHYEVRKYDSHLNPSDYY
jgi:murein DD-endopeptidase MepM/ murein hydrolase activator NlpD